MQDLSAMIEQLTKDGNKKVTYAQFTRFIEKLKDDATPEQVHTLFLALDNERAGVVSIEAFISWWQLVLTCGVDTALSIGRKISKLEEKQEGYLNRCTLYGSLIVS